MAEPSKVGSAGKAEAVEAAKTGAIVEVILTSIRPSLERAAETTTNQYLEAIGNLPPGTGLAIGFGLRITVALIEERGSVWQGLKLFWAWVTRKVRG